MERPESGHQVTYQNRQFGVVVPAMVYAGQPFDVTINPDPPPPPMPVAQAVPVAHAASASAAVEPARSALPLESSAVPAKAAAPGSSANPFANNSSANPFGNASSVSWTFEGKKIESDKKFDSCGPSEEGSVLSLSPAQVRDALVPLGLNTGTLRQIWELSDIERDGKLDRDEFCVAWCLCHEALDGKSMPETLPVSQIPPSKR